MNKIRVLWLSNKVQTNWKDVVSGGWLDSMAQGLISSGKISLGNISAGKATRVTRQDYDQISQWVVPSTARACAHGLPKKSIVEDIIRAVKEFSPDLIHVWGTEFFWGLLTARKIINEPALLAMQGVKGAIAKVFHGGLTFSEQLACIGIKEILRRSTIFHERKQFQNWEPYEREIITGHRFITTQTVWVTAVVQSNNSDCQLFHNERPLRAEFYIADQWQNFQSKNIFCSVAYSSPFKGLHIAIRALAILKKKVPTAKLHIGGSHQRPGIRKDGYVAWLNREAERLGVKSDVVWLGPLTASQTIKEMQFAAATVIPSFIESNSILMQEAMMVGIPVVASFVGGMSTIAKNEDTALYFPPGDDFLCAYQLARLLTDSLLAERLSLGARATVFARNNREHIVERQIDIYRQVLDRVRGGR